MHDLCKNAPPTAFARGVELIKECRRLLIASGCDAADVNRQMGIVLSSDAEQ